MTALWWALKWQPASDYLIFDNGGERLLMGQNRSLSPKKRLSGSCLSSTRSRGALVFRTCLSRSARQY